MAVQMTKSQLIEKIAAENEVVEKDVKGVLETLATIGYKELKKNGVFLVPGFAKFVVIKKTRYQSAQRYEPLQRRTNDVQGQTCSQDRQSTPGQGSKRRGMNVKRPRPGPFSLMLETRSKRDRMRRRDV